MNNYHYFKGYYQVLIYEMTLKKERLLTIEKGLKHGY